MTPEKLAEVAGSLTEAQRAWLASHKISNKWLAAHGLTTSPLMERAGSVSKWGGEVHPHYRLTPLGLAVRRHLLDQAKGSEGEGR